MWEYAEAGRLMTVSSVYSNRCIYCQAPMLHFPAQRFEVGCRTLLIQLSICRLCGWWNVYGIHQGEHPETSGDFECHSATIGCLKELDLNDVSTPVDQVRQYSLAKKECVFDIHPKLFEDVVCSVFKDCGRDARVTAYSGDDGVDVILDNASGGTIGVQVKRYRMERRIEAEQIRSLAGALLVGEHTNGIFVTTSTYRSGARKMAQELSSIGYPIQLVDGERFLNALGIAQVKTFELDRERLISYLLKPGAHLGSGLNRDFVPGEDLREREIVASIWHREELIDLCSDGT
jgi:restriction system protein